MSDVMEQGRGVKQASMLFQGRIQGEHPVESTTRQVEHAERMGESAGFSAVKR